jgi:recombination protein RecA
MGMLKRGTITDQIAAEEPDDDESDMNFEFHGDMRNTVSTGSTLLDLAISGKRKHGGGIPGGIIIELFGPSSSGKTQLMGEICASVQKQGGKVRLGDPETKFDPAYASRYGFNIQPDTIYIPDTPADVYKEIYNFVPTGNGIIDCIATDSIAALVAKAEMTPMDDATKKKKKLTEDPMIADKMGGMKPKEMHALIRKAARKLKKSSILCIFTNQLHDNMSAYGARGRVPGGHAVPFFATLRISLSLDQKIEERIGFVREIGKSADGKSLTKRIEHEKVIGIETTATLIKNHIDDPFREAPLRIIFGHGFDDIGANMQWLKEILGMSMYLAVDKGFVSLLDARRYIQENKKQAELREMVCHYWMEIEQKFHDKLGYESRER